MNRFYDKRQMRVLEVAVVILTVCLSALLYKMSSHKLIVLNLYFLPIVLAAFYLGRYRSGLLALLSVMTASIITVLTLRESTVYMPPLVTGLAILLWGAVLGLTAMLVGTLSDEHANKIVELHEAQVGVVQILTQYLHCANPTLRARSTRVADLCEQVAKRLRLPSGDIDDIRVAALLFDIGNLEITARVIRKAVGDLQDDAVNQPRTFHGSVLVQSLGSILTGAFPLLLSQQDQSCSSCPLDGSEQHTLPYGARIIFTVRAFDTMMHDHSEGTEPEEIIKMLRTDPEMSHDPAILDALLAEVNRRNDAADPEPELVMAGRDLDD